MQIANITMNNGSAVATTFNPMIKDGLLVQYANTTPATAALFPGLSVAMRPAKGDVVRKVTLKVTRPYEYTDSNGVKHIESCSAFLDVLVPSTAPSAAVDDIVAFASGFVKDVQVVDAIKNGAFPY